MEEATHGSSEDPWPYEYLVNALCFFAMDAHSRDDYLPTDFTPVLFHCEGGDVLSGNTREMVCSIYAEILGVGRDMSWAEDERWDSRNLENAFGWLYENLFLPNTEDVWKNWESTRVVAGQVLNHLGWNSLSEPPEFSAAKLLNEYSYGAYSAAIGDDTGQKE